jgi:hypothetical protein
MESRVLSDGAINEIGGFAVDGDGLVVVEGEDIGFHRSNGLWRKQSIRECAQHGLAANDEEALLRFGGHARCGTHDVLEVRTPH